MTLDELLNRARVECKVLGFTTETEKPKQQNKKQYTKEKRREYMREYRKRLDVQEYEKRLRKEYYNANAECIKAKNLAYQHRIKAKPNINTL